MFFSGPYKFNIHYHKTADLYCHIKTKAQLHLPFYCCYARLLSAHELRQLYDSEFVCTLGDRVLTRSIDVTVGTARMG